MAFAFLLTLGLICALVGGVLLWLAVRTSALAHARAAAQPISVADLIAGPGAGAPGGGMVSVSGTARPGPDGVLRSPVARAACVWWRVLIVRKDTSEHRDPSTEASVRQPTGLSRTLGHLDGGTVVLDDGTAKAPVDMTPVIPDARWRTAQSETAPDLGGANFYLRNVRPPADWRTDGYRQGEYAVPPADKITFTGRLRWDGTVITVADNKPLWLDRPSATPDAQPVPRSKQPQFVAGALLVVVAVLALVGAVIAVL